MQIDLAAMILRAGKTRQAVFVGPPLQAPGGFEQQLRNIYLRVVRLWGRAIPEQVMPVYGTLVAEGMRDATPDDVHSRMETVDQALTRLVVSMGADLEDWIVRVEAWHRGRFTQQFTPAGVDLSTMLGRGDVRRTLQATLGENLALIRSLNDQMRNDIGGAVFRGLTARQPAREVAKEIRRITGVGRSRAELIAADQLQKLTGALDQERQEQCGLDKFQWAHSGKKHPRPHHIARNGEIFRWDSVVGRTDPPGRAIRCGCRARAVVDLEITPANMPPHAPPPPPNAPFSMTVPPPPRRTGPPRYVTSRGPALPRPAAKALRGKQDAPGAASAARMKRERDYLLRRGKATGNEHLIGYDDLTGAEIQRTMGGRDYVHFTNALEEAAKQGPRRLVLQHNHPRSSSLSTTDVRLLDRNPGIKEVWAHGHNGSDFVARIGELPWNDAIHRATESAVRAFIQGLVTGEVMTVEEANLLHNHIVWTRLNKLGRVSYKGTLRGTSKAAWERNSALFNELLRSLDQ